MADRRPTFRPLVAAGLAYELLLILSFVPAPLVPRAVDSHADELLPFLASFDQLFRALAESLPLAPPAVLAVGLQSAALAGLALSYGLALWLLRGRCHASDAGVLFSFAALFLGTAVLAPYVLSGDIFNYVIYGRVLAVHGTDPYHFANLPARYPEDPFHSFVEWREVPSVYGPLWTLLSAALAWVGGERVGLTILLFRLFSALVVVATAALIWRVLRERRPELAALGTAAWAWSPLVVVEGGASGHNDVLLALCLVLALASLVRARPVVGLLGLAAALLVKYSAVVLGPLYLVTMLRRADGPRERLAILAGLAAAALLALAAFLPFQLEASLAAGSLASSPARFVNSPPGVLFSEARRWLGDDTPLELERLDFRPWWGAPTARTDLFARRGGDRIGRLEPGAPVFAVDRVRNGWQRVYDPAASREGFVPLAALAPADPPAGAAADPRVAAYQASIADAASPTARRLNLAIRGLGWLVVALVALLQLRAASTWDDVARGWLVLLMLVYWLVATWFHPWYLLWALGVAALRPSGALAWSVIVWAALIPIPYYGLSPLEGHPTLGWLFDWRAVPMFLSPVFVFAWSLARRAGPRPVGRASVPASLAGTGTSGRCQARPTG